MEISNFFYEVGLKWFGHRRGGSGKRLVNITRRNAIAIKAITADDFFDIYSRYHIIHSIINKIALSAENCPVWISKDGKATNSERDERRFTSLVTTPSDGKGASGTFLGDLISKVLIYGTAFVGRKRYNDGTVSYFLIDNRRINAIRRKADGIYSTQIDYIDVSVPFTGKTKRLQGSDVCIIGDKSFLEDEEGDKITYRNSILAVKDELEAYANLVDVLKESYGNGGARKIISFKNSADELAFNTPLRESKEELNKEFKEEYGGNSGDKHYVLSQQDVSVADLTSPVTEFDGYNILQKLECSICNAFDYPVSLLGLKTGAYKSQTEAEKSLYVGCISPLVNRIFKELDAFFGTNLTKNGKRIELDYSELDFFQDGKQKKGAAIQTFMQGATQAVEMGAMSVDEVKNELNNIL